MKKDEELKEALGTLLNAYREVGKLWDRYGSLIEQPSYPYSDAFDAHCSNVEEWVEDFCSNIDDINSERETIPITYATIKRKIGWSKFAEMTNRNVYAINEGVDFEDREMFYISEEQANSLGL